MEAAAWRGWRLDCGHGHASPGDTDEWIRLSATQYVLEMHAEGEEVLKPTALPEPR
jgi:hypothetical protein